MTSDCCCVRRVRPSTTQGRIPLLPINLSSENGDSFWPLSPGSRVKVLNKRVVTEVSVQRLPAGCDILTHSAPA